MKNLIIILSMVSSFAFAQEQFNPNLIIDLTEKQAFERYKKSNIRKALGLKLSDFNYQEMILFAQTQKLSDIIILNNQPPKTLKNIKNTYELGKISLVNLRETGSGYPCEDCQMIVYSDIKNLNKHPFYK